MEHIGSTSVPGLVAKPTIDILSVADDLDAVLSHGVPGYEHRPGSFPDDDRHLFFRKMRGGTRLAHLHVLHPSSPEVEDYRLFRDWLRADATAAARYARLKQDLAIRHAADRQAYVEAKQREVDVLMEEARRWGASRRGTVPGR